MALLFDVFALRHVLFLVLDWVVAGPRLRYGDSL